MLRPYHLILLFCFVSLVSCHSNRWDVEIKTPVIKQEFQRFDQDLFSINPDSIWKYVPGLEKKYGSFFELYNQAIINIGGTNQLDYADKLQYFISDPYIEEAYREAQQVFEGDVLREEIRNAFSRYHYYFPEKLIPHIYTHISGFNQSMVVDSAFVGISLDKYLGVNSKYYAMLRTPVYLRSNMYPAKIPADVMFSWGLTEYPYASESDNLSSQMIYYGKMHVFLDALLPETPDSVKWGISKQKLQWCAKNERQMWLYLVENKLLFNSSYKEIKRFIDDGPFTTPFSKESPARTGRWLGYQIVNAYLKQHPQITLKQLLEMEDYQRILNESKYKP